MKIVTFGAEGLWGNQDPFGPTNQSDGYPIDDRTTLQRTFRFMCRRSYVLKMTRVPSVGIFRWVVKNTPHLTSFNPFTHVTSTVSVLMDILL